MPAEPRRVKDLFVAALDMADANERAEMLDRECGGDAELRQRVTDLLAAHDAPHAALNKPLAAPPDLTSAYSSPNAAPSESIGSVLAGKYKLLQEVGEGGMGSVYMADQLQPVKRRVAVKVIKAGMDSARVLARFEAERQALALMDHPNIAKVLDAGATESGRPFFVMELVKGVPLTQFCDQHKLTVLDRLNLFMQICSAVQHAHQKGIIHRDLKPTNILVESHDGKPVPKVIDFGLAKATSGIQLSEHTLFTALGTVAGTPLYMAPEQAAFNAVDVDTRADVYALGVILYELLTGTTPIERVTFKKAAFDEMMRMIRELEPVTPSSRLSSSESKASVAAVRQMEPAKLGRYVRGELDWIVMKSLSKERDRRYESATAFAKDIERFLNHEPVLAGPPSAGYKLRKFVRRNRPQVVAGALVLLVLVGGMSGTTYGLVRADAARRAESEQRQIAEKKQHEAEAEKARAEQAEAETLADYRASTDDAIEQLIGSKPELGPKEKAYLENTLERWKVFARRQGDDERSRAIRAEGHFRVGLVWDKLGRTKEALTEYQNARDIQQMLAELFPIVPAHRQSLARTRLNLGNMLADLVRNEDAQMEWEAARDIEKKLVEQFPNEPENMRYLAGIHQNLGILLARIGKSAEARVEQQAALELRKKLVAQFPGVPAYLQALAYSHNSQASLLIGLEKRAEAQAEYGAARDLQKALVKKYPAVPEYQQDLARTHNNLGALLRSLGKLEDARVEYEVARDIRKRLAGQFPVVAAYEQELARTHNSLGILLTVLGKGEDARLEYLAARDAQKKLVERFPAVSTYQVDLGGGYGNYGILIRDDKRPAASLEWFDLAIRTLQPVLDREPRNVTAKQFLRNSYQDRAKAYDLLKKATEAVKDWDRAVELSPPVEQPRYRAGRATSQLQAGMVAEAVAEVEELSKDANSKADQWYDFACVFSVASGKIADKKKEYADRAMELLQKAVKSGYKDAVHMAKDTDLDSLRGREDFKKLMAELEKKSPPKPQLAPPPREVKQ
jgi:eukaryotic-like serine/threonine-protein kinase